MNWWFFGALLVASNILEGMVVGWVVVWLIKPLLPKPVKDKRTITLTVT
jgi:hypothetical protein